MTELLVAPPPPDAIGAMANIRGLAIKPSILVTQQGPGADGRRGPEEAGAVLILQATFADPTGAEAFWRRAVVLMERLAEAPGFIRRYAFPDGPTITMIALWRSADDAKAFADGVDHADAVRDLFAEGWQHSHFAAVWTLERNHGRIVFCLCGRATPVEAGQCSGCGEPLFDLYAAAAG